MNPTSFYSTSFFQDTRPKTDILSSPHPFQHDHLTLTPPKEGFFAAKSRLYSICKILVYKPPIPPPVGATSPYPSPPPQPPPFAHDFISKIAAAWGAHKVPFLPPKSPFSNPTNPMSYDSRCPSPKLRPLLTPYPTIQQITQFVGHFAYLAAPPQPLKPPHNPSLLPRLRP